MPKIWSTGLEQIEKWRAGFGGNIDKKEGLGSLDGVKWRFTRSKVRVYDGQRYRFERRKIRFCNQKDTGFEAKRYCFVGKINA